MPQTRPSSRRNQITSIGVVLALAAGAFADVLVDVGNGDKIQGSIDGPGTADTFRLPCPRGATLKVKVKGKKGLRPTVAVAPPEGPMKGVGETLESLPMTGVYEVRVAGDGSTQGDYALSASFKLPKKTTSEVTLGEGETTVDFAAVAGTVLKVKVKAGKGSAAVPRILRVEGPDAFLVDLGGARKSASAKLGKTELTADGDYRVVLTDDAGPGGDAEVTVQLKQPKGARRKLDLRSRAIGTSTGERLAVSDVVDTTGGVVGVALPGDGGPDSIISGSNVNVPAGALTSPTPILVSTTTPVKVTGGDGPAGPSVFFGPEGLTFAQDVDVTIPVDLEPFGGDLSQLRVYTRDARGRVRLVDGPYDIDTETGTCTFQVAHFSSFVAAREGAAAAAGDILGVWKQVQEFPEEFDTFLILNEDGSVEVVGDYEFQGRCIRTVVVDAGAPLDMIFEVVGGRLRFVDDPEPVEYERAKKKDVPKNCDEL